MNWYEIKGYPNYECNKMGEVRRKSTKRSLKPIKKGKLIKLYNNGVPIELSLGRVIFETIIGPIPEGKVVHHRNGLASDNSLNNLMLLTRQETGKITGIQNARVRGVYKIDPKTNKVVDFYRDCVEAAKAHYCDPATIRNNCKNKTKTNCTGFIFRFQQNSRNKYSWE